MNPTDLEKQYRGWSSEDLLRALTEKRSDYTPEAAAAMESALRSRNVAMPEPPAASPAGGDVNSSGNRPYCSRGVFFYLYLAMAALALAPGIGMLAVNEDLDKILSPLYWERVFGYSEDQLGLLFLGVPFALTALVLLLVLVYRLWAALPPGAARTTPGKGAGFLLIPVFSLYWNFVAFYGWAQDYNRHVRERSLPAHPVSPTVAMGIAVLNLIIAPFNIVLAFAGLPNAGTVLGLPLTLLMLVFIHQAVAAVNALPAEALAEARTARRPAIADGSQPTGKGVASLVLGICSLLLPYIGIIPGIVGIVLAVQQRRLRKTGVAMAGLILSIAGTAFYGLCLLGLIMVLLTM